MLEKAVLSWLTSQFGYDENAGAILTSGGSLATFAAVVAARDEHLRRSETDLSTYDLRLAVGYTSNQSHRSVSDAFRLAGYGNVRKLDVDKDFRLRTDLLREALEEDRKNGKQPFIVIATAGSTSTGAIDHLSELATICAEQKLWLHVDAAYGGAFMLCDQGRHRLEGIEKADSITFDPHKGLFLPYGTGCLLYKNDTDRGKADSSPDNTDSYLESFTDITPAAFRLELSRPYRGLRLWLPLMLHGAGCFREALSEKLDLAAEFHSGLQKLADEGLAIEIVAEPQLTIIPFRLRRLPNEPIADWNHRNTTFHQTINEQQRSFLTSTRLRVEGMQEEFALTLRVCILSHRTHSDHIKQCLEDISSAARAMLQPLSPPKPAE